VLKDGKKYYRDNEQIPASETQEESADVALPLGVRLLLSEWKTGTNPKDYVYNDPYDVDERQESKSQPVNSQRRNPGSRNMTQQEADGQSSAQPVQSQAPPTILAARALTSSQPQIGASIRGRQLAKTSSIPARLGFSQTQTTEAASSQPMFASTQVLPGPFGGRQDVGKKKAAKKRVGGF